jgi:hypothetical protein
LPRIFKRVSPFITRGLAPRFLILKTKQETKNPFDCSNGFLYMLKYLHIKITSPERSSENDDDVVELFS